MDAERALAAGWDGVGDPASWLADNCPCDTCRSSSPDRLRPRVMTAVTPRPGESLVGLLCRVTRRNHLRRLRVLLAEGTPVWHAHSNLAARDDVDFDQLAHACRLAPHEVEDRRYRQVELTPDLPGATFHGATIPLYDLDLGCRRIAPSWLAGEPHYCALGHHSIATHCPASGDLLIDRCPRCDGALLWTRIHLEGCHRCGLDMRAHEPARVTARQQRETRIMLDVIHPAPARHGPATAKLPDAISGLDRGTIFELGWRLGGLLTGTDTGTRREAGGLPVDTRLHVLAAGSRILSSWPDDLYAALRGVAVGSAAVDPSLPAKVRSLAKAANLWPSVRDAIFAAAPGLGTSSSAGVRSVIADAANAGELAGSLGVSQRIYERMRGKGAFDPVAAGGTVNQHLLFDAADAAPLRELLADRLPLASASERLDISHHGVGQLCCVGELTLITDKRVLAAVKEPHITKSSLDHLVARIDGKAADLADTDGFSGDLVPLLRAMRTVGGREKPWAAAVHAILSGDLPVVIDRSRSGRLMGRISIPADKVHMLAAMTFDETAYPTFTFDGRINRRDTEDLLNVDSNTFSRAMKAGQAPVPNGGTYDRAAILARASELMSGSEILVRWGRGKKGMPAPMRDSDRPIRVGHLGWKRLQAEAALRTVKPSFSPRNEPAISNT